MGSTLLASTHCWGHCSWGSVLAVSAAGITALFVAAAAGVNTLLMEVNAAVSAAGVNTLLRGVDPAVSAAVAPGGV